MVKFDLTSAFMLAVPHLVAGAESTTQFNPIESLFSAILPRQAPKNGTKILDPFAPTPEEREAEKQARRRRMRERNERVKETFKNIKPEKLEKVPQEQLEKMDGNLRKLSWSKANSGENSYLVDPGEDYDMWSQAFRMLGGFIDCDNSKDGGGSHDDGDGGDKKGCSRWMMWAAVSFEKKNMWIRPNQILAHFCFLRPPVS